MCGRLLLLHDGVGDMMAVSTFARFRLDVWKGSLVHIEVNWFLPCKGGGEILKLIEPVCNSVSFKRDRSVGAQWYEVQRK